MPQNKTGDRDKGETDPQPTLPIGLSERQSIPALVKGAEPKPVEYEPQNQQAITEKAVTPWFRKPQVILSALTLAAIIAQLVIFDFQWGAMQTAIEETKETRELEYRAYVGAKGVVFQPRADNPAWADLTLVTTNTGRTPGREGKIRVQSGRRDTPLPENAVVDEPEHPGSKIVFVPLIDNTTGAGLATTGIADMILNSPPAPAVQPQTSAKPAPVIPPVVIPSLKPPETRANNIAGVYVYGIIDYKDILTSRIGQNSAS